MPLSGCGLQQVPLTNRYFKGVENICLNNTFQNGFLRYLDDNSTISCFNIFLFSNNLIVKEYFFFIKMKEMSSLN